MSSRPLPRRYWVSGSSSSSWSGPTGASVAMAYHRVTNDGDGVGAERQLDVDDLVAERLQQRAGLLVGGHAVRVHLGAVDRDGERPGDPQPAGLAAGVAEERLARPAAAAGCTCRRGSCRSSRRAAAPRRPRCGPAGRRCPGRTGPASSGPPEIRPRVGLIPNRPHTLAGIRIEPPPSLPWAAGPARPRPPRPRRRWTRRPSRLRSHGRPGGRADLGLGVAGQPELRRRGLAGDHDPGLAQRGDDVVVLGRRRCRRTAVLPRVIRTPATMFRSLIGIGTPVSGGSGTAEPFLRRGRDGLLGDRGLLAGQVVRSPCRTRRPAHSAGRCGPGNDRSSRRGTAARPGSLLPARSP